MSNEHNLEWTIGPNSLLWNFSGQDLHDPEREREVEVRIDSPVQTIQMAIDLMVAAGWRLTSTPDPSDDPHQRLFFRRTQNILDDQKRQLFGAALQAAKACNGRFHSWMVEEDASE